MPPLSKGSFDVKTLTDGTRAFHIRVRAAGERVPLTLHERPGCVCGCGGGWTEPGARTEMGNVLARIRAGVWERPSPPDALVVGEEPEEVMPAYDEYALSWLKAKVNGINGEKPISPNTKNAYRWSLARPIRFFAGVPLDEIDKNLNLKFKAHLFEEAREIDEAIKAGADLRDQRGCPIKPLGLTSIQMILRAHAAVLDEAVEDEYIDHHHARAKRMKVAAPKPKRTFLEMDELAVLLEAASEQDVSTPDLAVALSAAGDTAERVAALAVQGERPSQIASSLGLSKSAVSYHLRRLGVELGRGYVGHRAICEILGRSGVRVSELCALKIGAVRLHDRTGARFRIADAKTETGIRTVEVSPCLAEVIVMHLDRLKQAGAPTGPDAYLVPNVRGGRISRQRIREIVVAASRLASERSEDRGLPPLPSTTPHTLRRTYISIALIANEFDVKWVMDQVGHADSKMTLDVYAQLQQRHKRESGAKFDLLLGEAQAQFAATPATA